MTKSEVDKQNNVWVFCTALFFWIFFEGTASTKEVKTCKRQMKKAGPICSINCMQWFLPYM